MPKVWTKDNVIRAIRARHRQRLPMSGVRHQDGRLAAAAYRIFGSWRAAMLAAGLTPTQPEPWTRQRVIASMQARQREGRNATRVQQSDMCLYQAAVRQFGTWHAALLAAGLVKDGTPPKQREKWTRDRVIEQIQIHYPQRSSNRSFWTDHKSLASAAARRFGTRHRALTAAGFSPKAPKPHRRWNRQRVIRALRAWHRQGRPLTSVWKEDMCLYSAARQYFGSWGAALDAAGLSRPWRRWSREDVIRCIKERQRRVLSLRRAWKEDAALYGAAKAHFGNWQNALKMAGIEALFRRQWTRQQIIETVRAWHASGRPVALICKEDTSFYYAATRRFGNWNGVLLAAGLKSKPRKKWSRQRVIKELRAWYRVSRTNAEITDRTLLATARRLFGSLSQAFVAAGLEPRNRRWSRRRVIEAIQDRYVQGKSLQRPGAGNQSLAAAANRYFGNWPSALRAAGCVQRS